MLVPNRLGDVIQGCCCETLVDSGISVDFVSLLRGKTV